MSDVSITRPLHAVSNIELAIAHGIKKQLDEVRDRIIAEAQAKFQEAVRTIVGNVAINLADYYSLQRFGSELVIRVNLEPPK